MKRISALALVACSVLPGFALAQDATAPVLSLELNAADTVDQSCRLTFVLKNETGADIEQLVAETVLFSKDGGVVLLTLFDFGELPQKRTRVRRFQVGDTACEGVGQVLINGLSTCTVAGAASSNCFDALTLSTRTDIALEG